MELVIAIIVVIAVLCWAAVRFSPNCNCGNKQCGGACDHMRPAEPMHWPWWG